MKSVAKGSCASVFLIFGVAQMVLSSTFLQKYY